MSKPVPSQHKEGLVQALDFLRDLFPDTPLVLTVGFPSGDSTNICTASNLSAQHQLEIMSLALEGLVDRHPNATLN